MDFQKIIETLLKPDVLALVLSTIVVIVSVSSTNAFQKKSMKIGLKKELHEKHIERFENFYIELRKFRIATEGYYYTKAYIQNPKLNEYREVELCPFAEKREELGARIEMYINLYYKHYKEDWERYLKKDIQTEEMSITSYKTANDLVAKIRLLDQLLMTLIEKVGQEGAVIVSDHAVFIEK